MSKIKFITSLLILISTTIFSQIITLPGTANNPISSYKPEYYTTSNIKILENSDTVFIVSLFEKNNTNEPKIKIFKGTPYFKNRTIENSTIFIDNSKISGTVFYDLINQNIQFSSDGITNITVIKPDSFIVDNHKFINLNRIYKVNTNSYFERIFSDKNNLVFKKYSKSIFNFTDKNIPKNYNGEFKDLIEYYFIKGRKLKMLKQNEGFFEQFGRFKTDIQWFAETKKLNINNEYDIKDILKYFSYLTNK